MERQLQVLEATPDVAACFARMRQFRDGFASDADGPVRDGWTRTTMVTRTEVALAAGPIVDPPGRIGELVDWLARMREQGHRMDLIPEVLALRRMRPGSLTHARSAACGNGYLFAARQAILRRRERQAAQLK
jgi:hypothetical protein